MPLSCYGLDGLMMRVMPDFFVYGASQACCNRLANQGIVMPAGKEFVKDSLERLCNRRVRL